MGGAGIKILDTILSQLDEAGEHISHTRHPVLHAAQHGTAHGPVEKDTQSLEAEKDLIAQAGFNPFRGIIQTSRKMAKEGVEEAAKRGARRLVDEPFKEVDEALDRLTHQYRNRARIKGDRAWSFNLDHLDTTGDVEQVLRETAELVDNPKKVISWPETEAAAKKLADEGGINSKMVIGWTRAKGLNADQLEIAGALLLDSATMVRDAADLMGAKKAAGTLTDADRLGFQQILNRHIGIQQSYSGMAEEAGRTLNIMKKMRGAGGVGYHGQIRDLLNVMGGSDKVDTILDMLADADSIEALNHMTSKMGRPGLKDMIYEVWINGLLSGVRTHEVNFVGSGLATMVGNIDQIAAGAIGDIRGLASYLVGRGQIPHATLSDVVPYIYGELRGTFDGVRIMAKSIKSGESAFDPAIKMEARVGGTRGAARANPMKNPALTTENLAAMVGRPPPKGTLAKGLDYFFELSPVGGRLPTRLLVAEDDFWKAINYRSHLHAEAYRMARGEAQAAGVTDIAEYVGKRAPELVADMPEELHTAALRAAREMTFTAPTEGAIWGGLESAAHGIRSIPLVGKYVVPFARTPINIAKWATHHTPAALADSAVLQAIRKGGPQADVALGRIATGSTIMTMASMMYISGFLTGQGPTEKKGLSQTEKRLGQTKRSLRIPKGYAGNDKDLYYDISRTDPVGLLLTVVADTMDVMAWADDETSLDEVAAAISIAVAENFTDKTYLTGVADFFEAWVSDPKRFMSRWAERMGGSFVPTIAADINTHFFDRTQRQVDGILDSWRSRIPGLSDTLPPRRDLWGYEIKREHFNMFTPFQKSEFAEKPYSDIDLEIYNNRWNITKPSPNWKGIDLRQFEKEEDGKGRNAYDRYVELQGHVVKDQAGNTLLQSLRKLMGTNYYKNVLTAGPDGTRYDEVMSEIIFYRELAREQLLEEFPELGMAVNERQRKLNKAKGFQF
jgi:hypothetical protein